MNDLSLDITADAFLQPSGEIILLATCNFLDYFLDPDWIPLP
jgi:hypothetical protein